MKIAVFKPWLAAEFGGGSCYERGVWDALWRLAGDSRHEWVGVGWSAASPQDPIPMISLRQTVRRRVLHRVQRSLRRVGPVSKRRMGNPADQVLIRSGVDLVLSLNPYFGGTELPFITVVWDLQHRLQPHFPEVTTGGEWELREEAYRRGLSRATRVLVGTQRGRDEVELFYSVPPPRVSVIPLPVPDFAFQPAPPNPEAVLARHQLEPGFLLYPAQFWPHKNHRAVILALRRLKESGRPLTCVFVGSDRGNREHVEEIARREGVFEQVRWLGFVSEEELNVLYRSALALVYLSFFGPDNLPPLEAFALGCPVVAAHVPGASEQLGNAALLVDPTDPKAAAEAIEAIYSEPKLRRTLVNRGLARPRFTCEDYVRELWKVVDELESYRGCWNNQAYARYWKKK